MSSLVANYTDSEDGGGEGEDKNSDDEDKGKKPVEEDTEDSSSDSDSQSSTDKGESSLNLLGKLSPKKGGRGTSGEESDEDKDSSSDGDGNDGEMRKRKKRALDKPLDNPFRYFGSGEIKKEDSVLRVEFREQEAHKTAVLERHVKMTETDGAAITINGKKVCWAHRRGKCRFGSNCKWAHDSDILTNEDESLKHPEKSYDPISARGRSSGPPLINPHRANLLYSTGLNFATKTYSDRSGEGDGGDENERNSSDEEVSSTPVVFSSSAHLSGENPGLSKRKKSDTISDDEGEEDGKLGGKNRKKKRPGLVEGLVPGKKTMNLYYQRKHL